MTTIVRISTVEIPRVFGHQYAFGYNLFVIIHFL